MMWFSKCLIIPKIKTLKRQNIFFILFFSPTKIDLAPKYSQNENVLVF